MTGKDLKIMCFIWAWKLIEVIRSSDDPLRMFFFSWNIMSRKEVTLEKLRLYKINLKQLILVVTKTNDNVFTRMQWKLVVKTPIYQAHDLHVFCAFPNVFPNWKIRRQITRNPKCWCPVMSPDLFSNKKRDSKLPTLPHRDFHSFCGPKHLLPSLRKWWSALLWAHKFPKTKLVKIKATNHENRPNTINFQQTSQLEIRVLKGIGEFHALCLEDWIIDLP